MEPLESHVLLVDDDGGFAVGAIDETLGDGQGKYVQTESGTGFSTGWTHVVAVGPHILFVRDDGRFAVGHIDQGKPTGGFPHYVNTQSGTGFSPGWTHVVAVGPHILFVNNDTGREAVGYIDEFTCQYVNTESHTNFFPTGWTHIVAVGPHVLFIDSDTGRFEVGYIDLSTGTFKSPAGPKTDPAFVGWTHVVAVGPHVLFVDSTPPGRLEVGHIDLSTGTFKSKAGPEAHPAFAFAGATHVVAVGSYILSGGDDAFEVGYIDEASSDYVPTQSRGPGVGGFPGPFHLVAVGPHVLGVSPTLTAGFVTHIDLLGQQSETDTGPDFGPNNWTHVVAVA